MDKHLSYHITFAPPSGLEPLWPNGFWAVYAINGDEIAQRIKFDEANRKVVRRDPWSGYLGGGGSFEAVAELIANHKTKR